MTFTVRIFILWNGPAFQKPIAASTATRTCSPAINWCFSSCLSITSIRHRYRFVLCARFKMMGKNPTDYFNICRRRVPSPLLLLSPPPSQKQTFFHFQPSRPRKTPLVRRQQLLLSDIYSGPVFFYMSWTGKAIISQYNTTTRVTILGGY